MYKVVKISDDHYIAVTPDLKNVGLGKTYYEPDNTVPVYSFNEDTLPKQYYLREVTHSNQLLEDTDDLYVPDIIEYLESGVPLEELFVAKDKSCRFVIEDGERKFATSLILRTKTVRQELFEVIGGKKIKCASISVYSLKIKIVLMLNYSEEDYTKFIFSLTCISEYTGSINGVVWLEDDSWISREESDRGEWWQHNKLPEIPEECL